jgi:hypothetical protein
VALFSAGLEPEAAGSRINFNTQKEAELRNEERYIPDDI